MITRRSIFTALVVATSLALPVFSQTTPAVPASHASRVLVIPFNTLNVSSDQKWIGPAVQETLIADLGKTADYSPVAFQGQTIVEDNATAARMATEASVPYAVRGAVQVVNGEVRFTAQLIEAKSGDTVSTAIVTGPFNKLLSLEDDVASQLHIAPPPAPAVAAVTPAPPAATTLPPAYASPQQPAYTMPQPTYAAPQVYTAPPDYPAYYQYPDYDSDYPVYSSPIYYPGYSGIFIGGSGRFGDRHFHSGFPAGGHFGGGGIHSGGGISIGHGGGFSGGGHGGGRR